MMLLSGGDIGTCNQHQEVCLDVEQRTKKFCSQPVARSHGDGRSSLMGMPKEPEDGGLLRQKTVLLQIADGDG